MRATLRLLLLAWTIQFSLSLYPDDQPGCIFRPAANLFFAYNAHIDPNVKNWLCEESFEERLRVCVDVFQRTTQTKVETSFELKENVSRVCERRKMTFTQEFESGEPEFDTQNITIRNTTIEVRMFRCPITKLDLRYPVPHLKPPELYDIYISLARNDVTVAALTDSRYLDNICVRDAYLYPPPHLRHATPRPKPFTPEYIDDYRWMNDEYFQKLANKVMARKLATATGDAYIFYSTIFDRVTNKPNETTTPVSGDWNTSSESLESMASASDREESGSTEGESATTVLPQTTSPIPVTQKTSVETSNSSSSTEGEGATTVLPHTTSPIPVTEKTSDKTSDSSTSTQTEGTTPLTSEATPVAVTQKTSDETLPSLGTSDGEESSLTEVRSITTLVSEATTPVSVTQTTSNETSDSMGTSDREETTSTEATYGTTLTSEATTPISVTQKTKRKASKTTKGSLNKTRATRKTTAKKAKVTKLSSVIGYNETVQTVKKTRKPYSRKTKVTASKTAKRTKATQKMSSSTVAVSGAK